jgi:creatinine amidohydrolase
MWLGNSHHHMDFPGTLSAEPRVYLDLLNGLLENFIAHGFKRLVILNGHGGNDVPGKQSVFETRQKHRDRKDLLLLFATYWNLGAEPWTRDPIDLNSASWATPANGRPAWCCACAPNSSAISRKPDDVPFGNPFEPASRGWIMPDRSEPGHVGDPRSATAEKGEVLFQCFSEEVVKLLERVIAWDGVSWEG